MNKLPINKLFMTAFGTLVVVGGLALLVFLVILPRVRDILASAGIRGNTMVVDFHTHFLLDPSVPQLILDGWRIRHESPPLVEYLDGVPHVYLSASFLREHIDPFVFWDEGAGILFISTLYEMLEFQPGSEHFLVNGSPRLLADSVVQKYGDIFVPVSIIHGLYPLLVEYHPQYNMVVITSLDKPQITARVAVNFADIHYWPGSRLITTQLSREETLVLFVGEFDYNYPSVQDSADVFVRVRTPCGLLGYVLISEIEDLDTVVPLDSVNRVTILDDFIDNKVHHPRVWTGTEAINLVWEDIHHVDANRALMQVPLDPSLTVVSPTWFRVDDTGTHLNSVASREYVDWAHSQGVYVWPLVFDVWYTQSALFLKDRNARRHAINQLIEYVEVLNLNGINIDFEHLTAAEGPYKIQFLRELALPMRQRGVVLSAAVKVPLPSTAFYRRDLIAKTVDFVMVMTYDEHWGTSPVAGPNASLPWVRRSIENMLRDPNQILMTDVPRERLLMGLPFYNRIWREVVATGEVSHYRALGTNSTRAFFEEHGVQWVWNFEYGLYFGEVPVFYEGVPVIFRVWLEDARSIQEKMHVFYDNNLAGVAIWSRMFAIDEFWEVLRQYF